MGPIPSVVPSAFSISSGSAAFAPPWAPSATAPAINAEAAVFLIQCKRLMFVSSDACVSVKQDTD